MQEEKTTDKEKQAQQNVLKARSKKHSKRKNLYTLKNQLIVAVIFGSILTILITVMPESIVWQAMSRYNDSTMASMHTTVASNLIIAFVTLLYVALTYELVSENRKMRKLQTEPNVYLFIEPRNVHNDITDLFIQNIGMGAAYNIGFEVLSDYIYGTQNVDEKGQSLPETKILYASKALIIKNGIKYLATTQKKRLFSTMFYNVKELNLQNKPEINLRIRVKYEDNIGTVKKEDFMIDFYEVPANGIGEFTSFERELLDELKEIKTEIGNVSQKTGDLEKKLDLEAIDKE